MQSFSKVEKSIASQFRAKLDQVEGMPELADLLCSTLATVCSEAVPIMDFTSDDFSFDPLAPPYFKVDRSLLRSPAFRLVWDNSDLKAIGCRLAHSCYKRTRRMERHCEKTNAKIRQGVM